MVLATLLPFRPQPALLGGMAAALAGYFVAFGAWVFSSTDMDSMAWVGYLFSFPGAVIGAIFSKLVAPHDALPRPIHAFLLGFGFVAGGILVNQGIVCATVISCGVR